VAKTCRSKGGWGESRTGGGSCQIWPGSLLVGVGSHCHLHSNFKTWLVRVYHSCPHSYKYSPLVPLFNEMMPLSRWIKDLINI